MFSPAFLVAVILAYAAVLFGVARLGERASAAGKRWVSHPAVFALVLAVYCTTWTYYGSVGKATTDGLLFLGIYLGPTVAMVTCGSLMRQMVRLKNAHHLTSIADFISTRYAKSRVVAALVTVMVVTGLVPYLALQLKAVTGTFDLLTRRAGEDAGSGRVVQPVVIGLLILFTIVFGIRRLDPTERHPGMVVSLAAESIVKLAAFVAAGLFITGLAFGGASGFLARLADARDLPARFMGNASAGELLTWCTHLLLGASAFAFLPRQFHVGIVENPDDRNVRTAMWLTPLYLLLINLFVLPIALSGLKLSPPGASPDEYVLALPMMAGQRALSLFVFIGGFSAAIGMVMVETMTLSTMVSNHLLLPVLEWAPGLRFLRRYLLPLRWTAAAAFVLLSWGFEVTVGKSYMLVSMGMLSFAAVLQLAPSIVGGLLWRGASKNGALLGLLGGFVTWFHTLIVPAFAKSGWVSAATVERGPLGIGFLRPEAMFGLHGLPPLAHGVFWTVVFNVGGFVVGSILFEADDEERRMQQEFLDGRLDWADRAGGEATVDAAGRLGLLEGLLSSYFPPSEAKGVVARSLAAASLEGKSLLTVVELSDLQSHVERALAGAVGAASARAAMRAGAPITGRESEALATVYGRMLADLNLSPSELRRRIDYQKERETLLTQQATALERANDSLEQRVRERTRELSETNVRLTDEVEQRERAQAKLIEVHAVLVETALKAGKAEVATNVLHNVGNVLNSVNVSVDATLASISASRLPGLGRAVELLGQHEADVGEFLSTDPRGRQLPAYLARLSDTLAEERAELGAELESVRKNVEHIKTIIHLQQTFAAGGVALTEVTSLPELVEDALRTRGASLARRGIRVVREIEPVPPFSMQKHKVLQIFINLLSNAEYAVADVRGEPTVTLRVAVSGGRVRAAVIDNGMGIRAEDLTRIFQHGFTTRLEGHGFGLHSCAIAAQEMGGTLTAASEGVGEGATFVLELPMDGERQARGAGAATG